MLTPPRRIYTSQPVIFVYAGATQVAALRFSEHDNQAVVHGPFKRPYQLAEDTVVEGGRIYSHQAGIYYRYRIEYQVWGEGYTMDKRDASNRPQITEYEIGLLDRYASEPAVYDILFYPHADLPGAGQSNDPNYHVLVKVNDVDRPTLAQDRLTAVLEVESRQPVTEPRLWL